MISATIAPTPRWRVAASVLLALGLVVGLRLAAAASAELPPLVNPASQERHPGKVIWLDLVTNDLAAAERFYGSLFGWTFEDHSRDDRRYAVALLDSVPVAGIAQRNVGPGERQQPAWLTFLAVPDLDVAQRNVVAQGGKVLRPPRDHAARGRQAIFADPQGAVFAALQSSSGDPSDVLREPGDWIWASLITTDAERAAVFYRSVFGYQVVDQPNDDGRQHALLVSDNYARASANAMPASATHTHPHWLNFVRVVNASDSAAKAQSLGGRVLVAPHVDRHGGMIAVVADPQGAPIGLMEWNDEGNAESAR